MLPPIYFVRHGETDWNRQGLIQGSIDIPLNDTGHGQAQAVARAFVAHPDVTRDCRFVVSPQQRARQTMDHIADALGLDKAIINQDRDVRELEFGIWEGKPFWELKDSPVYPADREGRYFWRPEAGESYADGRVRIERWLLGVTMPTVVVAHGAIGRCLMGTILNLAPADLVGLKTPQGCYCRLENGQADWFDANGDGA
jgi:broad specificity phosphatase PhoE